MSDELFESSETFDETESQADDAPAGPSEEELAEKAGLHRAYFWDIETGRNTSLKTAYKISSALGVKLAELFDF